MMEHTGVCWRKGEKSDVTKNESKMTGNQCLVTKMTGKIKER